MPRRQRFTGSPINERQQELSEQEQALEREMARYKRLIAEAPQRAKEAQERREQELVEQNERRHQRLVLRANTRGRSPFDAPDVEDAGYSDDLGSGRPTKPRRAQLRAARTRLAVMLVAVMAAGAFVLFLLIQLIHHLG